LGWQPGPADPRTLRLAAYTTPELPEPPPAVNWTKQVRTWPLYRNNMIGDCVPVSCAHLVQGWTRNASGAEHVIGEDDVVRAYSAISGYDPATGANDHGCRSLDALNYWRNTGIGGRSIAAYMRLDHLDLAEVRTAIHLFGGVFLAAQLPRAADAQFDARQTWTVQRGPAGRRGSWGGHAMRCGAYGTKGVTVSTWGRTQTATWGWWNAYAAEAYAVVSTDWLDAAGGRNPLGIDLDAMVADLRRITS
jgi:hypothetical protein